MAHSSSRRRRGRSWASPLLTLIVAYGAIASPSALVADPPPQRVAIVVDEPLYAEIRSGLGRYEAVVAEGFGARFQPLHVAPTATVEAVRERLRQAHAEPGPPLRGAILIGRPPVPLRGDGRIAVPAPLYYEDFDAEWSDADGDGVFEEVDTDRAGNPTEIWTSWWLPPAEDPEAQVAQLNLYLDKLARFHRGEISGQDGFLFIASPINSTEITESWTVPLRGVLGSAGHALEIWSRRAEEPDAHHPDPGPEFVHDDLAQLIAGRRWHHAHIITHGSPGGFFWDGQSLTTDNLDFSRFAETGANLVTTSGCSNGNFRGRLGPQPVYTASIGNRLLFDANTVTVAYFGAASPQSTGIFAMYANELLESLMPERGSCLAEGYFAMRNADHAWGIEHHFFRGVDEKILCGDPFFRYHAR